MTQRIKLNLHFESAFQLSLRCFCGVESAKVQTSVTVERPPSRVLEALQALNPLSNLVEHLALATSQTCLKCKRLFFEVPKPRDTRVLSEHTPSLRCSKEIKSNPKSSLSKAQSKAGSSGPKTRHDAKSELRFEPWGPVNPKP